MSEARHRVLVVDDLESIRYAISEYLSKDFEIHTACDGRDAQAVLSNVEIDLLITDIRMPRMDGLELIEWLRMHRPAVQYALMTAYNVDDYLRLVREHRVWNLIPKTALLDLRFVGIMATKLLTGQIFGVDKYFPSIRTNDTDLDRLRAVLAEGRWSSDELHRFFIRNEEDYDCVSEVAGALLVQRGAPSMVMQVIEELVSNALVRSPRHLREQLGDKAGARELLEAAMAETGQSPYEVLVGIWADHAIVAVTDPYGTLEREHVLERLERQVTMGSDGLPLGVHDSHGRGLYISREHLDHLVFNIAPGSRTEVIGMMSLEQGHAQRYRSVSIYQN